jgi:hypothetical protein
MIHLSGLQGLARVSLLLLSAFPSAVLGQRPSQGPPPSQYKQLAPGILASSEPLFATDSLPHYRTEVRDFVIGPNQAAPHVPLEGFALMELRSGVIEASINDKPTRHEAGSSWFVPRGARLALRNLSEAAVIHTTVFVPR